jgi:hypothetical protein
MLHETALWLALLIPFVAGFLCTILPSARSAFAAMCCCVLATAIAGVPVLLQVFQHGPVYAASQWLFLDGLSAYHYGVMLLIYCLSSAYAWVYFGEELDKGQLIRKQARLFSGLWCFSLSAMTLVLFSIWGSCGWVLKQRRLSPLFSSASMCPANQWRPCGNISLSRRLG